MPRRARTPRRGAIKSKKRALLAVLDAMFRDNVKARVLQSDGSYKRRRPTRAEEPYRSQIMLHQQAQGAVDRQRNVAPATFEPIRIAPKEGT